MNRISAVIFEGVFSTVFLLQDNCFSLELFSAACTFVSVKHFVACITPSKTAFCVGQPFYPAKHEKCVSGKIIPSLHFQHSFHTKYSATVPNLSRSSFDKSSLRQRRTHDDSYFWKEKHFPNSEKKQMDHRKHFVAGTRVKIYCAVLNSVLVGLTFCLLKRSTIAFFKRCYDLL